MENIEEEIRQEIIDQDRKLKTDEHNMLIRQIDKPVRQKLKDLAVADGSWQINREIADLLKYSGSLPAAKSIEKATVKMTPNVYSELVSLKNKLGYTSISDVLSALIELRSVPNDGEHKEVK